MNNGLLEHAQIFVAVAEAGSLTKAAIATGTPQASISRQLAALEKHLGCRLLHRSTRAVQLSDEGTRYLEHARRLLQLNAEAESSVSERIAGLKGTLRVACSNAFGRQLLIPTLADWHRMHPQMHVELQISDQVSHLIAETVDVAFRLAPLKDSRVVARSIATFDRVLVASKRYLQAHAPIRKLDDVRDHQCIIFSGTPQSRRWEFSSSNGVSHVEAKGWLRVSSLEAVQSAVLADLGLAITPRWFWSANDLIDRVQVVLPNTPPTSRKIYAVTPARETKPGKVRLFCDFVTRVLRSKI
jgi:DNA-binding transcriptional LysR family regulator